MTAVYVGEEFPDFVGTEVLVENDETDPDCPCYKILLQGEWIGNIDDSDLEFVN